MRWRAQLAENAKTLAAHHEMPEMFHNEIEGWRFPSALIRQGTALFFTDRSDPPEIQKKMRFVQKMIRQRGAKAVEIRSRGKTPLARLFSLISLGDWVSYELAVLNRVDPLEIPAIEAVKKVTGR